MRRNIPEKTQFLGKTIPQFPDHEIQEHIATGNNGHLFLAFNESTKSKLAFKIVPVDNLLNEYLDEARRPNVLDHPSVVRCHDVVKYPDAKLNCIVFIYDYVEGENLRDYMKKERSNIDIPFIENFLKTMFGLLYELDQRKLDGRKYQHGDLHSGNILVAHSEYDLSRKKTFRVTDFGVRKLIGQAAHANDYLNVAKTLRELLCCMKYGECEGRDRYVYNVLKNEFLGRHLFETDTSADPLACNSLELNNKLEKLDAEWRAQKQPAQDKLVTPFDYPNCEQIGNSHLLLKNLYSDRLLGLTEIRRRSNLMLTGPRGCGKTTVFRALSLEYLISTHESSPSDLEYIGIYYRCDDLYFSFPRYKHPKQRPEAFDIPMHFLIVTLLATTLEQIGAWAKEYFSDQLAKEEEALVSELWNIFEWDVPDAPSGNPLATLVNRLKKERKRALQKQRIAHVEAEPIQGYFGPGIMFQACAFIRKNFTFLENRPFYFFIDDYSDPKISEDLQKNLNRLVMHRSSDVFFKLSAESPVSFARCDIDGKNFVERREYDLVNLGLRYIEDNSNKTSDFLDDLFKRRFAEVPHYPVETLEELLGTTKHSENDRARAFRTNGKGNYYGRDTIAAMCSGDIHYMIRLVARMVEDNGGKESLRDCDTIPKISVEKQNKSIRAAVGDFMESIRTLPDKGTELIGIITAFGKVAHSYLMHAGSGNEGKEYPYQASRIEPYEELNLSEEAKKILKGLLRYSVLIEDPRGKSRRGRVVPRFYLRRYIIPHFRLTFSKRDSIPLENSQIEMLLRDPTEFENRMMLKSTKDSSQEDLF